MPLRHHFFGPAQPVYTARGCPSGRYLTAAGQTIRITHDPFGMAVSPDGKTTVTLHDGVFTIIDNTSLANTRVPSIEPSTGGK